MLKKYLVIWLPFNVLNFVMLRNIKCNYLASTLALFCVVLAYCSTETNSESKWETTLRNELQAESVKLTQVSTLRTGSQQTGDSGTTKTIDRATSSGKRYWQLVIINSKKLKHIMGDENALRKKCDAIKERVSAYEDASAMPPADTLHIVFIQSSNFLIFHSIHHKTVTYTLHAPKQ